MHYRDIVESIGMAVDGVGVAIIVVGAAIASAVAVVRLARGRADVYRSFRVSLGRAILLGLELLVAGDIIRTVATEPTLTSVAVLGGIVLIRTFLSFSLEVELHRPMAMADDDRCTSGPVTVALGGQPIIRSQPPSTPTQAQ